MLLLKATILCKSGIPKSMKEGLKAYRKAMMVIMSVEGSRMNMKDLFMKVQQEMQRAHAEYVELAGEPVDLEHLSEEEDYDPMVNVIPAQVAMLTQPFTHLFN